MFRGSAAVVRTAAAGWEQPGLTPAVWDPVPDSGTAAVVAAAERCPPMLRRMHQMSAAVVPELCWLPCSPAPRKPQTVPKAKRTVYFISEKRVNCRKWWTEEETHFKFLSNSSDRNFHHKTTIPELHYWICNSNSQTVVVIIITIGAKTYFCKSDSFNWFPASFHNSCVTN